MNEIRIKAKENKSNEMSNWEITVDGETKMASDWAVEFGINCDFPQDSDSEDLRKSKWNANIAATQSVLDALNNDSQMDNVKLQNLLDKRNNAFEAASKLSASSEVSIRTLAQNI
jgi:hypothetical protein